MKVWQYHDSCEPARLIAAQIPQPAPAPGEILVQVHAAGVTAAELRWFPTTHRATGVPRHLAVPGHEFSGTVVSVGPDVEFSVGQEVFGMNDWFADGATAEYCCAPASAVVPKPPGLTHIDAAAVPIGALTAWQGLFDRAQLQAGQRVLIHGGSGGVGVYAIQLARQRGAQVLTTASARNRDFLIKLGADQVIDYRTERFEEVAAGVDVVFDTVGGTTLARSWPLLSNHGRLVTIAAAGEVSDEERVKRAFFIVEPNAAQLLEIATQLAAGRLQAVVERVVPFDCADEAYAAPPADRGCGKIVISVIPAA